ncbi:MAG: hypothetical protein CMJ76_09620 [Planctomycetaceae bacterium]|nr:hypothetical protein [Planctomycetaceae bacterium]
MKFLQTLYKHSAIAAHDQALQILGQNNSRWIGWKELYDQVHDTAGLLKNLGVSSGNRVGVLAENSLEWILIDLACHFLHAVSVPLNTQLSIQQIRRQMRHSGISLIFVADKYFSSNEIDLEVPVVILGKTAGIPDSRMEIVLGSFGEMISCVSTLEVELAIPTAEPRRVASIVYTSGTTGEAKGVMLTEDNLVFNSEMALKRYRFETDTHQFNFLPFFHAFGRTCDLYVWLLGGHQLTLGSSRQQAVDEVAVVAPTHINGVPYFFEKLAALCSQTKNSDDVLGREISQINSGGTVLDRETFDFYQAKSIAVLEGYGLTETSPVAALTDPEDIRYGSVGRAIDGTEIKLSADKQVLIKGRHVCAGYYRNPEASAELICDGWLHTGDLGRLDDDQFLYVTGRKKELIVTSSGQNVWPQSIESCLQRHAAIEQAVVFGDGRKFLVAILFPNWEYFAERVDVSGTSDHWKDSPNVERWFMQLVEQQLEDRASFEQIAQIALLSHPLSAERDQLTSKGTLRRSVIKEQLEDVLERLYKS